MQCRHVPPMPHTIVAAHRKDSANTHPPASGYSGILRTATRRYPKSYSAAGNLGRLESAHGSGAGTESIALDSGLLENRNEQIAERVIVRAIEGEVPAVAEPAAREKHRHVVRVVTARVAQVAAE